MENSSTIEKIEKTIDDLAFNAEQGYFDALTAYALFRRISDICEGHMKSLKESAINERLKYAKNENVKIYGYEIELMPSRKLYSYKHCENWRAINQNLKDHEQKMISAIGGSGVVDIDTGLMIAPAEISYTAEGLKFTFKG